MAIDLNTLNERQWDDLVVSDTDLSLHPPDGNWASVLVLNCSMAFIHQPLVVVNSVVGIWRLRLRFSAGKSEAALLHFAKQTNEAMPCAIDSGANVVAAGRGMIAGDEG
jgi:hypothetical protein